MTRRSSLPGAFSFAYAIVHGISPSRTGRPFRLADFEGAPRPEAVGQPEASCSRASRRRRRAAGPPRGRAPRRALLALRPFLRGEGRLGPDPLLARGRRRLRGLACARDEPRSCERAQRETELPIETVDTWPSCPFQPSHLTGLTRGRHPGSEKGRARLIVRALRPVSET
jgi:hypothetical protein